MEPMGAIPFQYTPTSKLRSTMQIFWAELFDRWYLKVIWLQGEETTTLEKFQSLMQRLPLGVHHAKVNLDM